MEARAYIKYLRTSSIKLRPVLDMVRGKKVEEALTTLKFTNNKAAKFVLKAVKSALANAEQSPEAKDATLESLYIAGIYANQGPTLKRFIPRARGRAGRIRKRTSHIRVILRTPDN